MKRVLLIAGLGLAGLGQAFGQAPGPEITSWIRNTTGYTGYNGIEADCQQVEYSNDFVYVSASGVPAYTIGPWQMNPNLPADQNFVFKIDRTPTENTGVKTGTGLGQIALLVNGVVIFNAEDAFSYNNQGIWHQDANYFEAASFDATGGHPAPGGVYHYHRNTFSLSTTDSSQHSPIIGYAFDGFPIYGPFGYSDPNNAGSGIKRMISGYALRNMTQRTSLPDGTVLQANQYGPAVSGQYPLGAYVEDYAYSSSNGDLDEYNGRICVTPEYPGGTYAYFATTDYDDEPTYPYYIGPAYYGVLTAGNTAPNGGHVTITEPTTVYTGTVALATPSASLLTIYPNPAQGSFEIRSENGKGSLQWQLSNGMGQVLRKGEVGPNASMRVDVGTLAAGLYYVQASGEGQRHTQTLVIR